MQNFRDIKVWQRGHQLTLDVYRMTNTYPKSELFALTSQMGRAAMSIPANVAEGCVQSSDAGFAKFLYYSLGSASELEYYSELSKDLEFIKPNTYETFLKNVTEVKRMITPFIKKLKAERSLQ
jgi:four helix bundle protein